MTTLKKFAVLFAALAVFAAACSSGSSDTTTTAAETGGDDATTTTAGSSGGDDATTTTAGGGATSDLGLPIIDPLDVPEGEIAIAGSSTVFPLSVAIIDRWQDEGGPPYSIDSIGSGGGFERFCVEGASDISNASRPIKDKEVDACKEIGRDPIEIRVGTDALSLVISNGNYFAQNLTFEEIAAVFAAPGGATWDTINPGFPAHPIQAFSPGADSGTFDFFFETIYPDIDDAGGTPPILESGVVEIVGEDDNLTVRGVADDGCTEGDLTSTCSIGYFGFAFFQQNSDILQRVGVDAGDGPVIPRDETVNDNSYPISRPLFMYTDPGIVGEKPQVAMFIAYYLNTVNEEIVKVGYFPAPQEKLQEAADAIAAAAGF